MVNWLCIRITINCSKSNCRKSCNCKKECELLCLTHVYTDHDWLFKSVLSRKTRHMGWWKKLTTLWSNEILRLFCVFVARYDVAADAAVSIRVSTFLIAYLSLRVDVNDFAMGFSTINCSKNNSRKVCICKTKKHFCVAKSRADRDHEGLFKSVLVGKQGTRNDEKSRRLYGARR